MPDRWIDEHVGDEARLRPGFETELDATLRAAWRSDAVATPPAGLRGPSGPSRRVRVAIWATAAAVVLIGGAVVLTRSGHSSTITSHTGDITSPATADVTAAPTTSTASSSTSATTEASVTTTPTTAATTPVVAHTESEQTVLDYLTALADGRYDDAAKLLGEGGLEWTGRADLRPLFSPDGTLTDLPAALRAWCEQPALCAVPVGLATDNNRVVATFAVDGQFRSTVFVGATFEGSPLVHGLPMRLPPGGGSLNDVVPCRTSNVQDVVLADLDGDGWKETVTVTRTTDNLTVMIDACGTTLHVPQYSTPSINDLLIYTLDIGLDGTDELLTGGTSVDTFFGSVMRWDGSHLVETGQQLTLSNPHDGQAGTSFGCSPINGGSLVQYTYQYEGGTDLSNSTALSYSTIVLNPDGTVNPIPMPAGRFELPAQQDEAFHLIAGYCGNLPVQTG